MSLARPYRQNGGHFRRDGVSSYARNTNMGLNTYAANANGNYNYNYDHQYHPYNANVFIREHDFSRNFLLDGPKYDQIRQDVAPSSKKRKLSALPCEITARPYQQQTTNLNQAGERKPLSFSYLTDYTNSNVTHEKSAPVGAQTQIGRTALKRDRATFEEDEVVMSRDEIERLSPSRKDGIDALHETHLRYSYCTFLQNLGARLDLPQTTIGTAMVLCHRFFVRRSHASHDRFLIATATLFLAAKSEETTRPLNDVLKVSCELLYRQDFTLLSCMFPIDWFEQYRERITEAEQLILTTLNFELNVQHPYESLTSTLQKLGFSQSALVNMALNLVSAGLRSSLWLQFKPHQIAAGAAYLAAKFLNMNLPSCHNVWNDFHTSPSVLKEVAHQLTELM